MIETAINMKDEKEKTTLTGMIANHMKKCYIAWSKSSVDDKTILKHLERLSKGKLILDKDFVLIDDAKATSKKANGHNSRNKKNNYKSKKRRY